MIHYEILNKAEKDHWLPRMFDLLYANMQTVAPGELPYEGEKQQWLENVSPALEKAPRQVLLCLADKDLVGYVQYYTRGELLMVEEVQLRKDYHRSFLFYRICSHLLKTIPDQIRVAEAYAEKRNRYSQKLMQKLGMEILGEEGPFLHLRGPAGPIRDFLQSKSAGPF